MALSAFWANIPSTEATQTSSFFIARKSEQTTKNRHFCHLFCRRAPVSLFDEIVLEIKSLIFSNHYHSFLKNGQSFAAQRALEWAAEYKDMGMSLQKSIVIQLFEEYHHRKRSGGEFLDHSVILIHIPRSLSFCFLTSNVCFWRTLFVSCVYMPRFCMWLAVKTQKSRSRRAGVLLARWALSTEFFNIFIKGSQNMVRAYESCRLAARRTRATKRTTRSTLLILGQK